MVGPAALHLDLTLATWAADGLLAVFFFVAGLELKHELVLGSLSKPCARPSSPWSRRSAAWSCPRCSTSPSTRPRPTAPPGRLGHPDGHRHRVRPRRARGHGPQAAGGAARVPADPRRGRRPRRDPRDRDLLHARLLARVPFAARARRPGPSTASLQRRRVDAPVALPPARPRRAGASCTRAASTPPSPASRSACSPGCAPDPGEARPPPTGYEHPIRPISAGICVPLFAFFSAGVDFRRHRRSASPSPPRSPSPSSSASSSASRSASSAAPGSSARFTRACLSSPALGRRHAPSASSPASASPCPCSSASSPSRRRPAARAAKIGVLSASVLAALLAAVALRARNRHYAAIAPRGGRRGRRRRPGRLPGRRLDR